MIMSKSNYLPISDSDRAAWLKNFSGKLPLYGTTFGLAAADIAAVAADSAIYSYTLDQVEWFKKESAKRVAFKNQLADGDIGSAFSAFPVSGIPSAPPAAVPAGIFKRIGRLVQRIKNHLAYSISVGHDLGIETHETINNKLVPKPILKVTMNAGKPVIKWKRGNMVAADIFVDRTDGKGFVFLATLTAVTYTDGYKLPEGILAAQWRYKAIYKMGNEQTGEFSDLVCITVVQEYH